MADLDIGEMFLNFVMPEELRSYCGVDVSSWFGGNGTTVWQVWTGLMMGFKPSPYGSIKSMLFAEEVIKGCKDSSSNPFQQKMIRFNLPCSVFYTLTLPWVSKVCANGELASDFATYIDDVRTGGTGKFKCQQATQCFGSVISYLGIQDAPCKRRPASQMA
eukprot:12655658-Ditylum_brightwellii.AAC.1